MALKNSLLEILMNEMLFRLMALFPSGCRKIPEALEGFLNFSSIIKAIVKQTHRCATNLRRQQKIGGMNSPPDGRRQVDEFTKTCQNKTRMFIDKHPLNIVETTFSDKNFYERS